jgi:hypothetical protein
MIGKTYNDAANHEGIYLSSDVKNCTLLGNYAKNFKNIGSGTGYGIRVLGTCNYTAIISNTLHNNTVNLLDLGDNSYDYGNILI